LCSIYICTLLELLEKLEEINQEKHQKHKLWFLLLFTSFILFEFSKNAFFLNSNLKSNIYVIFFVKNK
jgi:hypothetical protein